MTIGGATSSPNGSRAKRASQTPAHLKSVLPLDEGSYPRAQHMAQGTRSQDALLGWVSLGGLQEIEGSRLCV